MRRFLFLFILMAATSAAFGEQAETFLIRNADKMSGTEEFTVRKTESGYNIEGSISVRQDGKEQTSKEHTALNRDWTLASYKNETPTPTGPVVLEANVTNGLIIMKATWPKGTRERGLQFTPKSFVLENFVPSQMEAALRANTPEGTFNAIVPSVMDHFEAKVAKAGSAEGALSGKTVKLSKYTVSGGGPVIEVWIDDRSGDLMRLYVPSQDVEYLRDGFKLSKDGAGK